MDYTGYQTTAKTLIKKYGTSLSLYKASLATFNPTTGQYTSTGTSTYTVYGLLRSPYRMFFGDKFPDGTLIQAGDREAIIAVSATATPEPGDRLAIGGIDFGIVTVLTVEPGGTDLMYRILCRK